MPRRPAPPPTTFFLQGPGASQDAVFAVVSPKHVRVTAEDGATGCYDDLLTAQAAREVWEKLVARGWHRVAAPRRTARQIGLAISG